MAYLLDFSLFRNYDEKCQNFLLDTLPRINKASSRAKPRDLGTDRHLHHIKHCRKMSKFVTIVISDGGVDSEKTSKIWLAYWTFPTFATMSKNVRIFYLTYIFDKEVQHLPVLHFFNIVAGFPYDRSGSPEALGL